MEARVRDVDATGRGVRRRRSVDECRALPEEHGEVRAGCLARAEGDRARDLDERAELEDTRAGDLDERAAGGRGNLTAPEPDVEFRAVEVDRLVDGTQSRVEPNGHADPAAERTDGRVDAARERAGDACGGEDERALAAIDRDRRATRAGTGTRRQRGGHAGGCDPGHLHLAGAIEARRDAVVDGDQVEVAIGVDVAESDPRDESAARRAEADAGLQAEPRGADSAAVSEQLVLSAADPEHDVRGAVAIDVAECDARHGGRAERGAGRERLPHAGAVRPVVQIEGARSAARADDDVAEVVSVDVADRDRRSEGRVDDRADVEPVPRPQHPHDTRRGRRQSDGIGERRRRERPVEHDMRGVGERRDQVRDAADRDRLADVGGGERRRGGGDREGRRALGDEAVRAGARRRPGVEVQLRSGARRGDQVSQAVPVQIAERECGRRTRNRQRRGIRCVDAAPGARAWVEALVQEHRRRRPGAEDDVAHAVTVDVAGRNRGGRSGRTERRAAVEALPPGQLPREARPRTCALVERHVGRARHRLDDVRRTADRDRATQVGADERTGRGTERRPARNTVGAGGRGRLLVDEELADTSVHADDEVEPPVTVEIGESEPAHCNATAREEARVEDAERAVAVVEVDLGAAGAAVPDDDIERAVLVEVADNDGGRRRGRRGECRGIDAAEAVPQRLVEEERRPGSADRDGAEGDHRVDQLHADERASRDVDADGAAPRCEATVDRCGAGVDLDAE